MIGHPLPARAVAVPEHLGMFEKGTFLDHSIEGPRVDEMIVGAITLGWAAGTGGIRDGKMQAWVIGNEPRHQRRFTGTGRRGYEEQPTRSGTGQRGHRRGVVGRGAAG